MDIVQFYTQVLSQGALVPDDQGYIRTIFKDKRIVEVCGRKLVMPISQHHRDISGKEIFHPLSENNLNGISDVMHYFSERVAMVLNVRAGELLAALTSAAFSEASQSSMSKEKIKLISTITTELRSEESLGQVHSFLTRRMSNNVESAFIKLELRRIKGSATGKANRQAVVTFPLYEALKEDIKLPRKETKFPGLKNASQVSLVLMAHEAIFPGIADGDRYSASAYGVPAPFFQVLMDATTTLRSRMEEVSRILDAESSLGEVDFSFMEVMRDNKEVHRLIMEGGSNTEAEPNRDDTPKPRASAQAPAPASEPVQQAPAPAPAYQPQQQYQPPQQQQPKAYGRNEPEDKKRLTKTSDSFAEWNRQFGAPSQMGAQGAAMAQAEAWKRAVDAWNQSYRQWFEGQTRQFGAPPLNMPAPHLIPPGQLAPQHPSNVPHPQQVARPPMMPGAGYGYQQPPQQGYGYPQPPQQGYGYPQQPPNITPPGYGYPQPPQQGYGYPAAPAAAYPAAGYPAPNAPYVYTTAPQGYGYPQPPQPGYGYQQPYGRP